MQKKWIFLAGILLCLGVGSWLYYLYQKPRSGVVDMKAHYTLTAQTLYQSFVENEAAANEKYIGKVLVVEGAVEEVSRVDDAVTLLLSAGEAMGGVNCSFSIPPTVLPAKGQKVKVKGRCTGFLIDVALVDAVLQ